MPARWRSSETARGDVRMTNDRAPRAGRRPAAALAVPGLAQEGDPAAGEKVFRKCAACHAIEPDGPNKVGPSLYGVVGRTTGTVEGFKYSDAMLKAGEEGHVWTPGGARDLPREPEEGDAGHQDDLRRPEEARGARRPDRLPRERRPGPGRPGKRADELRREPRLRRRFPPGVTGRRGAHRIGRTRRKGRGARDTTGRPTPARPESICFGFQGVACGLTLSEARSYFGVRVPGNV